MNKIYVGTTNSAKLKAVKEVFKDFEVIAFNSKSNVSKQPLSEEETINGALNRANNLPQDGLRLGLEAGVTIINDICFLINFGVLINENNEVFYAGGTYLPLPNEIKKELYENKKELKDVMNSYSGIVNLSNLGGAISFFTKNEVERKDIFIHICKLLYGQLKHNKEIK